MQLRRRNRTVVAWAGLWALAVCCTLPVNLRAQEADAETPAAEAESAAENERSLAERQAALAARYKLFDRTLEQMARHMRELEPARAELLDRAIAKSRGARIHDRMTAIRQILAEDDPLYSDALEGEGEVLGQLRELLTLLESEDRLSEIERRKRFVQNLLKDLTRRIAEEKDVRAGTQRGDDAARLGEKQQGIADRTRDLADRIDEHDGQSPDGKESKPGEGQDGKSGETKDGQSDPKDGKPGETKDGKDGEKKPSDGSKDGKDGQSESKDGQSGKGQDGKSGQSKSESKDGKPGDSKDGKPNPDEKKPSDQNKSGEQKTGQSKDSQSQPKDGKSGKSQPGKGGQSKPMPPKLTDPPEGDNPPQDGQAQPQDQSDSQSQNDRTPGREEIERAIEKMERAIEELKQKNRDSASRAQDEAIAELLKAKEKLEEILRQLREEEKELMLAALEARFQKMLKMQIDVLGGTEELAAFKQQDKWSPREQLRVRDLAVKEDEIAREADKALVLLREEGSSVAFPEAVEQIRDDMRNVAYRLQQEDVGEVTVLIEQDIVEALREMVDALRKELEKLKQQKQKQQQQGGQPSDPALVDTLAELKMLRSLQHRINRRTRILARAIDGDGEQATQPDLVRQLQDLSRWQARIQEATYDIATGRNK